MYKLVLVRHGESDWNRENRFTGWTDVDLSEQGLREARAAGEVLKSEGFTFDVAYTSVLKRAIRTLWIVLDQLDLIYARNVMDFPKSTDTVAFSTVMPSCRLSLPRA